MQAVYPNKFQNVSIKCIK